MENKRVLGKNLVNFLLDYLNQFHNLHKKDGILFFRKETEDYNVTAYFKDWELENFNLEFSSELDFFYLEKRPDFMKDNSTIINNIVWTINILFFTCYKGDMNELALNYIHHSTYGLRKYNIAIKVSRWYDNNTKHMHIKNINVSLLDKSFK